MHEKVDERSAPEELHEYHGGDEEDSLGTSLGCLDEGLDGHLFPLRPPVQRESAELR